MKSQGAEKALRGPGHPQFAFGAEAVVKATKIPNNKERSRWN
jgi:hypothetical protein